MKKISLVVPKVYHPNRLFDLNDPQLGKINSLIPLVTLKERLSGFGIDISTQDINPVKEADLVIFENMPAGTDPDFIAAKQYQKKMFLKISEWDAIHRGNDDLARHKDFLKIFTYQDDLVDNIRYFKLNYPFVYREPIPKDLTAQKKLCVMISGNKRFRHPYELYSKRIEAIRWFEKHHPLDFDLYGIGWDASPSLMHYPLMVKAMNHIPVLGTMMGGTFPSYRGRVERKQDILIKYKFAICYENACNVNGWITEKIFDCFLCGCVPVYWGAPNVTEHIPAETFVDKRRFRTYEELYQFLNQMGEDRYMTYVKAIEDFLKNERVYPFSINYFVETLAAEILREIGT
jgi:hypothetical protein